VGVAVPLISGQDYAQNVHYSVFNKEYLTRLLKEAGFQSVREWEPQKVDYHNFKDWVSKTIERAEKQYCVNVYV